MMSCGDRRLKWLAIRIKGLRCMAIGRRLDLRGLGE